MTRQVVLAVVMALGLTVQQTARPQPPPHGWESLFNGKDLTGWVTVGQEKWVDERGRVAAARVTSSGADHYDEPLVAAARTWRFRPALAEGRPTRAVQTVHVAIP